MSTQVTNYLIYGFKLDSEFTTDFWESDYYDKYDSYSRKEDEVRFLTDGMNGEYTYFGFIKELDTEEASEIILNYNKQEIIDKFTELYPSITVPEIKLISLPHWT